MVAPGNENRPNSPVTIPARADWPLIGISLFVLGLGVIVYVIDRPPGISALPDTITLFDAATSWLGPLGQSLPSFAHVFTFGILTTWLLGCGRSAAIYGCGGWLLTDCLFEIGQLPVIADYLSGLVPSWFDALPILDRSDNFFRYGTFDPVDLVFLVAGALAAYLVLRRLRFEEKCK